MLLIHSKIHQIGDDATNNRTKAFRERIQNEVPVWPSTSASRVRMYPSQSGKKRYAVRIPGNSQFNGQNTAISARPNQP